MGPGVGVLLREPLSNEQLREIDRWLIHHSKNIKDTLGDWEIWIDPSVFPYSPHDEPCQINVMVQGHAPYVEPIYYPEEVRDSMAYQLIQFALTRHLLWRQE
jgi:hypothetical protein